MDFDFLDQLLVKRSPLCHSDDAHLGCGLYAVRGRNSAE